MKHLLPFLIAPFLSLTSFAETVVMKTSKGDIVIELNETKAPITTKNFLNYVDQKFYDNTTFHRVISNFMIQGGGFELKEGLNAQKKAGTPIKNEASNGLLNKRGTIAMARTSDPNSATCQFFINVKDNPALNYPSNGGGYAVFGKVVKGMEVVDAIKAVKTGQKFLISLDRNGTASPNKAPNVPIEPMVIQSIRRAKSK